MTTGLFIATRAVHFGACLLFFGVLFFDRFLAATVFKTGNNEIKMYWQSRLKIFSVILLPAILLSGLAWFVLVAMDMSGEPPQIETLKTVWVQTQFGTVWKWRSLLWLAALAICIVFNLSNLEKISAKCLVWLQTFLAAILLGSLAWAGHGQENSPWHLTADVLHLLGAGLWPTGLLPFFLLLNQWRSITEPAGIESIILLTRRFSIMSLCSVATLTVTGLINSWFLVGSLNHLFSETYGRWLLVKILFFFFAIALGAVNLRRLKPRLSQPQHSTAAVGQLRRNVIIELILATAVIIIVAVLGILPPACH